MRDVAVRLYFYVPERFNSIKRMPWNSVSLSNRMRTECSLPRFLRFPAVSPSGKPETKPLFRDGWRYGHQLSISVDMRYCWQGFILLVDFTLYERDFGWTGRGCTAGMWVSKPFAEAIRCGDWSPEEALFDYRTPFSFMEIFYTLIFSFRWNDLFFDPIFFQWRWPANLTLCSKIDKP